MLTYIHLNIFQRCDATKWKQLTNPVLPQKYLVPCKNDLFPSRLVYPDA